MNEDLDTGGRERTNNISRLYLELRHENDRMTDTNRNGEHMVDALKTPFIAIGIRARRVRSLIDGRNEKLKEEANRLVDACNMAEQEITHLSASKETGPLFVPGTKLICIYNDVIEPVLEDLAPMLFRSQREINYRASLDPDSVELCGDPCILREIFRNVFANAIKYGERKTQISYGAEDYGEDYIFNVWDEAPVIGGDDIEKLFADAGHRRSNGFGHGFPALKRLLQEYHGDVWLDSGVEAETGLSYVNTRFRLPKQQSCYI